MSEGSSTIAGPMRAPESETISMVHHLELMQSQANEIDRLRKVNRLLVADKINLRSEMAGMVKIQQKPKEKEDEN